MATKVNMPTGSTEVTSGLLTIDELVEFLETRALLGPQPNHLG